MDGAMNATILAPWYYDKDKVDGCYNDKDNVGLDQAARLQRQRTTLMDGAMTKTRAMWMLQGQGQR